MPRILLCATCVAAAGLIAVPSHAEEKPSTTEVSGGGEIGGHVWSAYTNTTVALSGLIAGVPKSIREDGWRLRAGAGYWHLQGQFDREFPEDSGTSPKFRKWGSFADVSLGYQLTFDGLTIKAFAGIEYALTTAIYVDRSHTFDDLAVQSGRGKVGAKLALESWYNLTPDAFAQIDMSWSSERNAFSGRARFGYRMMTAISVGPEISHWSARNGSVSINMDVGFKIEPDRRDDLTRYGAFVRYEWAAGEVSFSGGVADGDAYGTLNALLRF